MKFNSLFTAILLSLSFLSCTKEPDTPTPIVTQTYPVQGLWIGTYSSNTVSYIPAQGPFFYSYIIYPDGTIVTRGKGADGKFYYATGSWTLSADNIFSATVISFVTPNSGLPVTQTIVATYSNVGTLSNGVWRDTNNPNSLPLNGTFSTMQRVN